MGKRKAPEPQANDWLFSCPATVTTSQIVAALHAAHEPITELSARHWQEAWRVGNDILNAYGYPESYLYQPGQKVSWDSISDWMFIKCWQENRHIKNHRVQRTFVGEIMIIRECRPEVAISLAGVAESAQAHARHFAKQRPVAIGRLLVVLSGWELPILAARVVSNRVAWVVNPLSDGEKTVSC